MYRRKYALVMSLVLAPRCKQGGDRGSKCTNTPYWNISLPKSSTVNRWSYIDGVLNGPLWKVSVLLQVMLLIGWPICKEVWDFIIHRPSCRQKIEKSWRDLGIEWTKQKPTKNPVGRWSNSRRNNEKNKHDYMRNVGNTLENYC